MLCPHRVCGVCLCVSVCGEWVFLWLSVGSLFDSVLGVVVCGLFVYIDLLCVGF